MDGPRPCTHRNAQLGLAVYKEEEGEGGGGTSSSSPHEVGRGACCGYTGEVGGMWKLYFILLDTYINLPITKKNHNINATLMDTIVL